MHEVHDLAVLVLWEYWLLHEVKSDYLGLQILLLDHVLDQFAALDALQAQELVSY